MYKNDITINWRRFFDRY